MGALSGRVALVTGAARGIGLALASGLAGAGAQAIVHDRDAVAAEAAAAGLRASGLGATRLVHDLAEPGAPARMQAELAGAQLSPDILILCASAEIRERWDGASDAALALQSEVNLHATARLIKAFLPAMIARTVA